MLMAAFLARPYISIFPIRDGHTGFHESRAQLIGALGHVLTMGAGNQNQGVEFGAGSPHDPVCRGAVVGRIDRVAEQTGAGRESGLKRLAGEKSGAGCEPHQAVVRESDRRERGALRRFGIG